MPSETSSFLGPLPIEDLYGSSARGGAAPDARGQHHRAARGSPRSHGSAGSRQAWDGSAGAGAGNRSSCCRPRAGVGVGHLQADFPSDVLDGPQVRATALRLTTELAALLRSRGQAARTVTVAVRMADRSELAKPRTLPMASAHTDDVRRVVYEVLDGFGLQRARIRRIALTAQAVDGAQAPTQLTFDPVREARVRAEPVIDALNRRYGRVRSAQRPSSRRPEDLGRHTPDNRPPARQPQLPPPTRVSGVRGHRALYTALNGVRIDAGRLRRALTPLPQPRAADSRLARLKPAKPPRTAPSPGCRCRRAWTSCWSYVVGSSPPWRR
ncbi:hypothetical protein [Streptomyces sp. NBC_00868]|uniref:DinB/UmuC family translesion DNA polymerase n=1 Tax=Streptomyces sp. NBC_00868 TaxID=2903683 RepID=UPI003869BF9A